MAWVKLDDHFFVNQKARAVGLEGRALFMAGLCWCSSNRTDGSIDGSSLPLIAAMAEVDPTAADRLVDAGMWTRVGDGYEVVGYRKTHHCGRAPDGFHGPRRPKLTPKSVVIEEVHIDHVVPWSRGGSSDMDNLQVSHSLCNMRKGART